MTRKKRPGKAYSGALHWHQDGRGIGKWQSRCQLGKRRDGFVLADMASFA